jgi:predicted enzyme related to lactoylglutathione lyase
VVEPELGWVIIYVPDVREALTFYGKAFGLRPGFVDAGATFGQLETGQTKLSFASDARAEHELRGPFRRPDPDGEPFNVEVCLVFQDPHAAYQRAVAAGCAPVAEPELKPHGQVAGFVRDVYGNLVEIASPLGAA